MIGTPLPVLVLDLAGQLRLGVALLLPQGLWEVGPLAELSATTVRLTALHGPLLLPESWEAWSVSSAPAPAQTSGMDRSLSPWWCNDLELRIAQRKIPLVLPLLILLQVLLRSGAPAAAGSLPASMRPRGNLTGTLFWTPLHLHPPLLGTHLLRPGLPLL